MMSQYILSGTICCDRVIDLLHVTINIIITCNNDNNIIIIKSMDRVEAKRLERQQRDSHADREKGSHVMGEQ